MGTFGPMEETPREPLDPRRIGDQPALQSSSGRIWIGAGAVFLVVIVGVLISIIVRGGPAVPFAIATGAIAVVLYLALLIARITLRPGTVRLRVMAAAMIGMAVFSLVGLVVCVAVVATGG